jgi:hypothetical protein
MSGDRWGALRAQIEWDSEYPAVIKTPLVADLLAERDRLAAENERLRRLLWMTGPNPEESTND